MTARTGWALDLCQDECRDLSKWFASRIDARQVVRMVCAEIKEKRMTDTTERAEALRLADELDKWARDYATTDYTDAMANKAAALLRLQAERELALMAESDQHQATATALIALLADIRKACGDNGKRMQPELVEFIGAMSTERDRLKIDLRIATDDAAQMLASTQALRVERDRLREEVERTSNNRDMWKGQCERQAEQLAQMREEVERLSVERERWYTSFEHVSRILSGIHALMYPEPFTLSDGRTLVFRPKDPHEMLQALSDRIRAIPDEVAAIDHARTTHKDEASA